jgi:uncharacterized lipoprotein YddW (UPF0748 family)
VTRPILRSTPILPAPALLVAVLAAALILGACARGGTSAPSPSESAPTPEQTSTSTPSDQPTQPSASEPTDVPTTKAPEGPAEVRAIWIHLFDDTLKTPASVDAMVDRAADANVNTLFVEVVRRQDAYYTSDVLPRTNDPSIARDFDMLAHVLQAAHDRGLVVHAWYPVLQTYHHRAYEGVPAPPGWVWTEHGPSAPEEQRWATRKADGTWAEYLDPALPEVKAYVAAALAEIVERYPVDGIHLDYPRYDGPEYGFHPRALEQFRSDTGFAGTPAPTDPGFSQWRRDQATGLVQSIRAAVDAVDPNVPISAAVIAQRDGPTANRPFSATRAYADYFQDWANWIETGLIDVAVPMQYFEDSRYPTWFDEWTAFASTLAAQHDALIVGGQGSWLNPADASLDQIDEIREARLDGVSLYSYQQTQASGDLQGLLDLLKSGMWAQPAPVPSGMRR